MASAPRGLRRLNKPYYLLRPGQILSRHRRASSAQLPWGLNLSFDPDDAIGSSIARTGVYDLLVTEVLHRLADAGETAIDVGANIGYITSVLSARTGPRGQVLAFEPHPRVFRRLESNVAAWPAANRGVVVVNAAVSDRPGGGTLITPNGFEHNAGLSMLSESTSAQQDGQPSIAVELLRLDDVLEGRDVHVAKVDVEGHELGVFRGAEALLGDRRVRDIVFEASTTYPSEVTALLEQHGYRVFTLEQSWLGPRLKPPHEPPGPSWDAPSYLATANPDRAEARLRPRGWQALRRRR